MDNIPETMLKATFSNFRKRCELLIYDGGRYIELKKKVLLPLKNSSLSSLKWYITCEMVTYGYFFIDFKKRLY